MTKITSSIKLIRNPISTTRKTDDWTDWYYKWSVDLIFGDRRMNVDFYTGRKSDDEPTTADVVYCLLSDFQSVIHSNDFEEWSEDLGYDTDSRKDEKIYDTVKEKLEQFTDLIAGHFTIEELPLDEEEIEKFCE